MKSNYAKYVTMSGRERKESMSFNAGWGDDWYYFNGNDDIADIKIERKKDLDRSTTKQKTPFRRYKPKKDFEAERRKKERNKILFRDAVTKFKNEHIDSIAKLEDICLDGVDKLKLMSEVINEGSGCDSEKVFEQIVSYIQRNYRVVFTRLAELEHYAY